ncbi:MAG: hypothetical protein JSV97_00635 [candidate division WOR-3 bacterium]|nr:MAG: hypothetical protein JSV97_00635 [candidate division WOR-3 bacterium]
MKNNFPTFSWAQFGVEMVKDLGVLIGLLLVSFYVVYFTSQTISRIFFLALLLLFFFLKKDYFWFAFFFIVAQGPGNFFADFSGTSLYRLPLYTFVAGFSFTPLDLFVILAFIKALTKGRKIRLHLEKPLFVLLLYMIFVFFVTSFLSGTTIEILAWNIRWLFYYSIIISFLYLVNRKLEIYQFSLLIFPVVFFILFTQIYYLLNGYEIINLFNPDFRGVTLNTVTGALRPLSSGTLIVFFSFIFSIFLLLDKNYQQSKLYLYLVMVTAFLSVFLSATRLWFVIFSFILVGYIMVTKKKFLSTLGIVSVGFLVVSTLIYSGIIPPDMLFQNPWLRVQQVFNVARGDIYSVESAMNRLVNQLPIMMKIIKQNPFIGYGFSNITMIYYDSDLGFFNTILMLGMLGLGFFIYFFIKYFELIAASIKKIRDSNTFKIQLKVMTILWVGILIGYFSTWDFFTMYFHKIFFVSILIALTEFFISQAEAEEVRSENLVWTYHILNAMKGDSNDTSI